MTEHLNARINPGVSKTRGRGGVRVGLGLVILGLVSALNLNHPNPKQHSIKKNIDLGPDPAGVQ